jgi:cytidine deaminase
MHTVPARREARQSEFSAAVIPKMNETRWQLLAEAAKAACANAYCRYSGFPVGAAVLTAEGAITSGCNVENASFGLSVCAERNAIFHAVADGAKSIVALVVYTPTQEPVAPCGACRQVIAEFGRDVRVRSICAGTGCVDYTLDELLPRRFSLPPL